VAHAPLIDTKNFLIAWNLTPPNSDISSYVSRLFFILILGFEFMHFGPQLTNKLSIYSI
jgi:hypothetical protein